jgi:hypothetical protein
MRFWGGTICKRGNYVASVMYNEREKWGSSTLIKSECSLRKRPEAAWREGGSAPLAFSAPSLALMGHHPPSSVPILNRPWDGVFSFEQSRVVAGPAGFEQRWVSGQGRRIFLHLLKPPSLPPSLLLSTDVFPPAPFCLLFSSVAASKPARAALRGFNKADPSNKSTSRNSAKYNYIRTSNGGKTWRSHIQYVDEQGDGQTLNGGTWPKEELAAKASDKLTYKLVGEAASLSTRNFTLTDAERAELDALPDVEAVRMALLVETGEAQVAKKTSKYAGVTWDKKSGKWNAQIKIEGRKKSLGYFEDEEEAVSGRQGLGLVV